MKHSATEHWNKTVSCYITNIVKANSTTSNEKRNYSILMSTIVLQTTVLILVDT